MPRRDTPEVVATARAALASSNDFSGVPRVISAKSDTVLKRKVGVIGLNFFTGIVLHLLACRGSACRTRVPSYTAS